MAGWEGRYAVAVGAGSETMSGVPGVLVGNLDESVGEGAIVAEAGSLEGSVGACCGPAHADKANRSTAEIKNLALDTISPSLKYAPCVE